MGPQGWPENTASVCNLFLWINSSFSEQNFGQVGDVFGTLQKICMCLWKCSHYSVVIAPSSTKIVLLDANDSDQKKHTPLPTQKACQKAVLTSRGPGESELSIVADGTHCQGALGTSV